ncbi:MAG TPA: hypothetical protein VF510_07505 [Ktedonobacterales bacterium]
MRTLLPTLLVLIVALAAAVLCLVMPPLYAFEPRPLIGITLVLLGATAALWRDRRPAVRALSRLLGAALLWGTVLWCALSQIIAFSDSPSVILARRALPIVLFSGVWAYFCLPRAWQQRALLAVIVPCVVALGFTGWVDTPHTVNFQPYYLAVDSHQTLYATDRDTSVIRVFGPDGSLRAKLWPGLANYQGPPGPGFSPPGPFSDPDHLSLPATNGSAKTTPFWTPQRDSFHFCGLATDSLDRLYVPDPLHGIVLRFGSDGYLQARWPLPIAFQFSSGCIAANARDTVYLADARGAVLTFASDGRLLARRQLPEPIGEMSVSPDGARVYVLSSTRVYALDVSSGAIASWMLTTTSGSIVALPSGRVVVGNHLSMLLDVYCPGGNVCAHIGTTGELPGQFSQLAGLATDSYGRIYVADYQHRVIQCFTPAGHITALYSSVEDDEQHEGRRV